MAIWGSKHAQGTHRHGNRCVAGRGWRGQRRRLLLSRLKDAPVVVGPNWTGYYIGGNVGGAWATIDFTDVGNNVPFNNDTSGFFGGGQVGYAYQLGNLVIGPEIDIGGMDLSHTVTEVGGNGAVGSVSSGFYFDITGRLGYTWGPTLVYIKGGYA